jgi:cold shock CspA family protein
MEEKDLFCHGVISKLFPSNNMGLVRTESGREVAFSFDLVILVGEIKNPNDLKEGQEVGYDVGWTSKGLRVTKIKTYP